ncbi:MAG: heme exporter protein CcmB [Actinomycetota bacterium]
MTTGKGFITKTQALVVKDLRLELRARDTLPPMLIFALAVALLLAFTIPDTANVSDPAPTGAGNVALANVLAGFLWITILFAGLIGFARTFEVERREAAIESLLLVPVDRSALFLAKATANLAYIVLVQLFVVPLFVLLFGLELSGALGPLLLIIFLVDVGFVAVGTLFSSLAARTSSRELMLPIIALPALVPLFIAATELTSTLFLGGDIDTVTAQGWFGILVAFDIIFGIVGALSFEFTLDT